ncbi:DMT family transporter [Guggenheimella bovis]
MKDRMKTMKGEIFLLLTALIWGASFVSQKLGMDHNGPFTFSFVRLTIGWIVLIPIYFWQRGKGEKRQDNLKYDIIAGILCGLMVFIGITCQQLALKTTTAGKTAFITALYIILVPVFGIFLKRRVSIYSWIAVMIAVVGMYFLSIKGSFQVSIGDLYVFIGSFFWAGHILLVDHFVEKVHPVKLSLFQFIVASSLSAIVAFAIETPTLSNMILDKYAILFSGVVVVGGAFTLQILGQQYVEPALASIIMSFESVFAVLFGFLLLHETLQTREIIGCILMFIAILLAQKSDVKKEEG